MNAIAIAKPQVQAGPSRALTVAFATLLAAMLACVATLGIGTTQAHAATLTKAGHYGCISADINGKGIKSIKVGSGKMVVKTNKRLQYGKTSALPGTKYVGKAGNNTFKLSSSCKYYSASTKWGKERMSKSEGLSWLRRGGTYFTEWQVKGGKVVKVWFWGK